MKGGAGSIAVLVCAASAAVARPVYVNFESPHVHPVDMTPDAQRLLAVNTPDSRLVVFGVDAMGNMIPLGSVPVGIEPVSVRARTNTEAWVVNSVSDSVSIVDLTTMNVRETVSVGDEPADVVFAGAPQRAFVSVAQQNLVRVMDPLNPQGAATLVAIDAEEPRALATDGQRVYAAVFEGGARRRWWTGSR